uniref:Uncharacterized protein n=1 Tax=Plectus sambesii TaxID=2011161 RepID=A0A914XL32_9BILA
MGVHLPSIYVVIDESVGATKAAGEGFDAVNSRRHRRRRIGVGVDTRRPAPAGTSHKRGTLSLSLLPSISSQFTDSAHDSQPARRRRLALSRAVFCFRFRIPSLIPLPKTLLLRVR